MKIEKIESQVHSESVLFAKAVEKSGISGIESAAKYSAEPTEIKDCPRHVRLSASLRAGARELGTVRCRVADARKQSSSQGRSTMAKGENAAQCCDWDLGVMGKAR